MTVRSSPSARRDWLVPAGLIALSAIPIVAGMFRMAELAEGGPVTPENARFFAATLPVALHIASVTLYCILGAFQFHPGLRRRRPRWHRVAGRILVPAGLAAGVSGIWMALTYAIVPADTVLLHAFRLFFGVLMVVSIALGFAAILRRDIPRHEAWMRRGYAVGLGAGTQALVQAPLTVLVGDLAGTGLALAMGGSWLLNLAVAEWLIRRRPRRASGARAGGAAAPAQG
ncbi:MAG: DUF2306 domain-containing protein [Bauldia sp.]